MDADLVLSMTLEEPDGTNDFEVPQIDTISDGDSIFLYFKGKSIRESPTHDRTLGENTFQTSSKKLA